MQLKGPFDTETAGAEERFLRRPPIRFMFHAMVTRAPSLDLHGAAEKELAQAHHGLDDPEHRFWSLLAQGVKPLAFGRLQTVAYGFERRLRATARLANAPTAQHSAAHASRGEPTCALHAPDEAAWPGTARPNREVSGDDIDVICGEPQNG
jgi:hypothetical protein